VTNVGRVDLEHEQVVVRRGTRSGLPIVVAVHSTALGMAVGGCRMKHYAGWRDGVEDALRLSTAMTAKAAAAGMDVGGGKTVVVLPTATAPVGAARTAVLHDVGDVVESLGGVYGTGPDVGTGPDDMVEIGARTRWVFCRPTAAGGSGDSSGPTAEGVFASLTAICGHLYGTPSVAGRRFAIIGLGHVGSLLAVLLAAAGAQLIGSDVDESRKLVADRVGAAWMAPDQAVRAPVDVVVPAALGGLLTPELVPELRCAAVAGPANNQLADPKVAALLADREVLWVPDPLVSAGGVIYGTSVELHGLPPGEAMARVHGIGDTTARLLARAAADGVSPSTAVDALVARRLAKT
jgi:glutamate dehydrogenase/leucine dehydrogenase